MDEGRPEVGHAIEVNGERHDVGGSGLAPLSAVLRDELGLLGTKVACHEGRCGACTVLVDGEPVVSCLYPLALADGRAITTVEGLAGPSDPLTPVQQALVDGGGVQCGLCTPGVVMSLTSLLAANPRPAEQEVREALAGNVCRCTGYQKIVEAALAASNQ
jgi:aerobic-type carbon monoxide dehydrogenase small subunit (CoxS/CutS family)